MRVVPDEVAGGNRPGPRKQWSQARAVEYLAGRRRATPEIDERGSDVKRGHRHLAPQTRLHGAGPADEEWHADAPFVEIALTGAKREVRRRRTLSRRQAAVVAREYHERVVDEILLLEGDEHG